jgi:hypothetical protein
MPKPLCDLLISLQAVLVLALGALLGIFGSIIVWHKQTHESRRLKRAELLLRAIDLTYGTGTHTRCLIYSKSSGIGGVLNLPENPVDQIMAITLLHFPDASRYVQKLHEQQQELFSSRIHDANGPDTIKAIGEKMVETMNDIIKCLCNIAEKENLNQ